MYQCCPQMAAPWAFSACLVGGKTEWAAESPTPSPALQGLLPTPQGTGCAMPALLDSIVWKVVFSPAGRVAGDITAR